MQDPFKRPSLTSAVYYKDPWAALDWLEKAFGFERTMVISDKDGNLGHSELRFGDGILYVGSQWTDDIASPAALGGKTTQTVHVHLPDGIDAHCARAKAAGAVILQEPSDQFYGDRTYRARDLEGHIWTFGQTVKTVSRAEAEKATGLKIVATGWN
jgi:uncharacterized glyoxalase superfamily protein PhnB